MRIVVRAQRTIKTMRALFSLLIVPSFIFFDQLRVKSYFYKGEDEAIMNNDDDEGLSVASKPRQSSKASNKKYTVKVYYLP